MSKDLLFELGTEEIPPAYLPRVGQNFLDDLEGGLDKRRLDHSDMELFYTPRRIAVRVNDLVESQPDVVEKHRGPSQEIGTDDDGEFAIPAQKFAEGHGASVEDLVIEDTEEGSYFFVEEQKEGRGATEVVPELINDIIHNLAQPETMRWDDSDLEFIRPIRWALCIYGNEPLRFTIGNIEASGVTRGHRFHGNESIEIVSPDSYEDELKKNFVIPDPEERFGYMKERVDERMSELSAEMAVDEGFLRSLSNSLEYPSILDGSFPEGYLNLPAELLFKTLTGEARLIPLVDPETGTALSLFIGFRDGVEDDMEDIKRGYESVINARLRDSKFFFEHDREKSLESFLPELRKVTFQENLGSIWDKVERVRALAEEIGSSLSLDDLEMINRTVTLCKGDLVTEVVDEFPSLEGVIGSYYAKLDGERELVVQGIREHYRPRSTGDDTPDTVSGAVASIADKLDTLTGSFLIGEEPTGTRDPYGLRRKADGVLRTIIDNRLVLDLPGLVEFSGDQFSLETDVPFGERLRGYLEERTSSVLERVYGFDYDVVDAVMANYEGDAYESYRRAGSLQGFKDKPELKRLVDSFTRVMNILDEERSEDEVNSELMELEEELTLWKEASKKADKLEDLAKEHRYEEVIEHLLELKGPIDDYFDNVMVMADDAKKRNNRLNLLANLRNLFMNVGDLSRIITD
ncbi:glycine--tRNA ligase subunit beta [Candidatus Bipolaricaulota bacterium]|nr:glycine--tRNA ligase subunit beta [Candidatus Bipolaricaulota bacterium]